MLSIVEPLWSPAMREAAGDCFVQVGLIYGQHCTYEDYLRAAHENMMIGGDAFYCAGSLDTIAKLAAEGIPVVGHVGLIPARATWTGGFKAVGKTAAEAMRLRAGQAARGGGGSRRPRSRSCRRAWRARFRSAPRWFSCRWARAQAATRNICSPRTCSAIRAAISPATPRSTATSAPNTTGCSSERIAAFQEFRADVEKGAYPEDKHLVPIADAEFEAFVKGLGKR